MKNESRKNIIIVILGILVVILSVLVVLFAMNMISFNDNDDTNGCQFESEDASDDNISNDNDSESGTIYYGLENKEWVDHLKGKNIVFKKSEYNYEIDECQYKDISLSSEQIDKIIDELSMAKITKTYYGHYPGGASCVGNFKLQYDNNEIGVDSYGNIWLDDDVLSNKLSLDKDFVIFKYGVEENNFNYFYEFDVSIKDIIDKYK